MPVLSGPVGPFYLNSIWDVGGCGDAAAFQIVSPGAAAVLRQGDGLGRVAAAGLGEGAGFGPADHFPIGSLNREAAAGHRILTSIRISENEISLDGMAAAGLGEGADAAVADDLVTVHLKTAAGHIIDAAAVMVNAEIQLSSRMAAALLVKGAGAAAADGIAYANSEAAAVQGEGPVLPASAPSTSPFPIV